MKFIAAITLVAGLLAGSAAQAQEEESISKASAAAGHWLALLDSAGYGESWAQAATIFKHAVTEAEWVKAMQAIRAPLGVVKQSPGIAVGIPITEHPPHRSEHAQFTHSAPTLGV